MLATLKKYEKERTVIFQERYNILVPEISNSHYFASVPKEKSSKLL